MNWSEKILKNVFTVVAKNAMDAESKSQQIIKSTKEERVWDTLDISFLWILKASTLQILT